MVIDTTASPGNAPLQRRTGEEWDAVDGLRVSELQRQQRILGGIRVFAVPFAVLQVQTYYLPYPPGVKDAAWGLVAVLAVGALVVHLGSSRATTAAAAGRWAIAGLLVDTTVALGLAVVYTFDPDTAVWALLYLLPIEGAMVFQLRGAVAAWAVVAVGYVLRDLYGLVVLDIPFYVVSVSFRMGLGLMMAVAIGMTARGLTRERDRLQQLTDALRRRGEDLTAANAALQQARRAQIEFVAVTNHELRTPLTAIRGFALTLRHRWDAMDDGPKLAAVDAIEQQSRRLTELVEDLLTVSSMRAGGIVVSPRSLVMLDWLHQACGVAEVTATIHCDHDVPVQADSTRLLQVLVNLLTNARKHGEPTIVVTATSRGDRTIIEVADHGPGVPHTFVPRMFEEFTQASVGESRTAGGHGLGLAIVRYLVGALDGTVAYRQWDDGGAIFILDLPAGRARGTPEEGAGHAAAADPVVGGAG